jgi:hypothetical protein
VAFWGSIADTIVLRRRERERRKREEKERREHGASFRIASSFRVAQDLLGFGLAQKAFAHQGVN